MKLREFTPVLEVPHFMLIILLVSLFLMVVIFGSITSSYRFKIKRFTKHMSPFRTECYIKISTKKVYIKETRMGKISKEFIYDLEDFIYMLSINPDSKSFRELLKLVNNEASENRIKSHLKTLPDTFIYFVDYKDGRRSLAFSNINPEQDFEDEIFFQTKSAELMRDKKTIVSDEILDDPIEALSEIEIHSAIMKETRRFVSKGVTLFKISPKNDFIDSSKDFYLNTIQGLSIKREFAALGIKMFTCARGNLYGVINNERRRTYNSVNKYWINKFNLIFSKLNKRNKEYIGGNIKNYSINIYVTNSKDEKTVNKGMIFNNLSAEMNKNGKPIVFQILEKRAEEISIMSDSLAKDLKDRKDVVKSNKNIIAERGVKPIHEVYLDFPNELLQTVLKYSFKERKLIIETLIKRANKIAVKYKEDTITVNVDIWAVHDSVIILRKNKLKKNIHLMILEHNKIKPLRHLLTTMANELKELNVPVSQYVADENGANVDLYRIFESKYILLAKGLNDSTLVSDNFKLNLNNIINIKDKDSKIINIR